MFISHAKQGLEKTIAKAVALISTCSSSDNEYLSKKTLFASKSPMHITEVSSNYAGIT